MTAPIVHGYADWNRAAVEADAVIVSAQGVQTTTGALYVSGFIGNFKGVYVQAKAVFGNCRVVLNFYADSALVTLIDAYEIDLQQGDLARQSVSVLGPYLTVQLLPGPVTPVTFNLTVVSAPVAGTFDTVRYRTLEIGEFNTAIGAATTAVRDSIHVLAGELEWMANMGGGNWSARLQAVDKDNTVYELDTVDSGTSPSVPRRLWVPPAHIRIRATNSAGVPTVMNLYVTRKRN